jgi:hypothetical protein
MAESMSRCFVDVDVEKFAHFYESLVVHRAWQAANETTLMFRDAARDRKIADCAQAGLKHQLLAAHASNKALSDAIILMVRSFSKFAAYTRRFFWMRARKHEERYTESTAILKGILPLELFTEMELMVVHACWHAANVRSFLWNDAAFDGKEFENNVERFRCSLPRVKSEQEQRDLSALSLPQGECASCRHCGALIFSNTNFCSHCGARRQDARTWNVDVISCLNGACLGITRLPNIFGVAEICAASDRTRAGSWTTDIDEGTRPYNIPRSVEPRSPSKRSISVISDESFFLEDTRNLSLHAPTVLCRSANVLDDALTAWRGVSINEDGVSVVAYLEAASRSAAIIGCMGSVVAKVKSDVEGNIAKIQKNVATSTGCLTVEGMIREELAAHASPADACKEGSTSLAVLWLSRMLRFVRRFCSEFSHNPEKPLSECVTAGYKASLSQHHPWAMRTAVFLAIKGCPSRDEFSAKLGESTNDAHEKSKPLSIAMSLVLDELQNFMVNKGIEVPDL